MSKLEERQLSEVADSWLNNLADEILEDFIKAKEMGLSPEETDQYLDKREEERKRKLGLLEVGI